MYTKIMFCLMYIYIINTVSIDCHEHKQHLNVSKRNTCNQLVPKCIEKTSSYSPKPIQNQTHETFKDMNCLIQVI